MTLCRPSRKTSLADLLAPNSVAIVGASDDPTRIGGRPIAYMKAAGFAGRILPVNTKRDQVQGLPAVPSVADIEGDIDFAVIATPAPTVLEVLRAAAAKGAKACMVFSSGFAETGAAGLERQNILSATARDLGVRLIGPNCLGIFNAGVGFFPTFTSTIDRGVPAPGGVSIASQSGAFGSHIFLVSNQRGLGVRYWITTGNEADLEVAEAIELLAESDDVHTIMAYAESVKDGARLVAALEVARAHRKPVIFMKVGHSDVGALAATSHTASLAGEDAVYDAVLRQHGAYRARSTEEMIDIAYACRPRIYPAGKRLGLVTISGGAGVVMADAAADYGLDVAPMPADAQEELKAILPFAAPRNPVDVTAQAFNDMSLVTAFTRLMLERGNYDAILAFWTSVAGSRTIAKPLRDALKAAVAGQAPTLMVQSVIAPPEIVADYEADSYPVFEDPTRAVAAIAALMHFGAAFARGAALQPAVPAHPPLPTESLSEAAAKALLAAAGLPMVEDRLVTTPPEAEAAARDFAGPLALKIASSEIAHKTEIGGVLLGVEGPDGAAAAFETLMTRAREGAPQARIDGVLVSPLVEGGVECILGAKIDPVFGPVVLFGLGGVFTEVLKDVAFRRAPFGPETALEMIEEIKGSGILKGLRGREPVDLEALAEAISRLSFFAAAHQGQLQSVEMNPFLALPDRCLALDALIVTSPE